MTTLAASGHDASSLPTTTKREGELLSQSNVPPHTRQETAVTVERRGHVLLIGLNRPEKRNAFNVALIDQLAAAYYELEHDEEIRCGVLFGHGDHFTGGLDLA